MCRYLQLRQSKNYTRFLSNLQLIKYGLIILSVQINKKKRKQKKRKKAEAKNWFTRDIHIREKKCILQTPSKYKSEHRKKTYPSILHASLVKNAFFVLQTND